MSVNLTKVSMSEEELRCVKFMFGVRFSDGIGVGERIQVGEQVEPRQEVFGRPCGLCKTCLHGRVILKLSLIYCNTTNAQSKQLSDSYEVPMNMSFCYCSDLLIWPNPTFHCWLRGVLIGSR